MKIHPLADREFRRFRYDPLYQRKAAFRSHGAPNVGENRYSVGISPIVNDPSHDVCVRTLGNHFQEIAADTLYPVMGDGSLHDMGLIE